MCRMLGVIPKGSASVDVELLRSFRSLASCGAVKPDSDPGHGDGWGIVAWNSSSPYYLGREPNDAFTDPMYEQTLKNIEINPVNSPVIAHLRKASIGSKTAENTHPFVQGKWAFAHNGTIRKMNLKDRTDSEWFFESLMEELQPCNGDIVCAIARQVQSVRDVYQYSSMTFLLSDGMSLYAYRDCADSEDYYTVYYTKTPAGFVVSQEKFFESRWKELGNGQLLIVDRRLHHDVTDLSEIIGQKNSITA